MKGFKSITTKYILLGLVILGLIASLTFLSFWFTNRTKNDATRINLAGRERMLNYEMAWLLNKALKESGEEKAKTLKELQDEMALFEEVLYALRDGSIKHKLLPLPYKDGVGHINGIIEKWRSVIKPVLERAAEGSPGAFRQYNLIIQDYVDGIDGFVNHLDKDFKKEFVLYGRLRLAVMALLALVFIVLAFFIRKRFVAPILKLRNAAEEIEKGNLDVRVEAGSGDEIGDLCNSFNRMVHSLKTLFEEKSRHIREIEALASFPEKNPYPVLECAMDCGVTYLNPAARKLLDESGLKASELLPANMGKIIEGLKSEGKVLTYAEVAIKDTDTVYGEYIHFIPDRDVIRIYAYCITEHKRPLEALKESQKKYEELVNSIDGIMWEADAQTFRYSFVSKQAERILGYPVDRWINDMTFCRDHIHPDDVERVIDHYIRATAEKRPYDIEYRVIAADGRAVWVRNIVNVVVENDQPVRLHGVMLDITERRLTEYRLKRYSEELLSLADASNVVAAVPSSEDIYEAICDIAVRNFGLKAAWLGIVEEGSHNVKPVAQAGIEEEYLPRVEITVDSSSHGIERLTQQGEPVSMRPTSMAIKTVIPQVVNSIATAPQYVPWREEAINKGYNSLMAVPLLSSEAEIIGVLNMYSSEPDFFTRDRVRLFQVYANHAATAIENRLLIEGLGERVRERTRELEVANNELKKLFNAVEQAAEAILITDKRGIIQYVNPAFSAISGYTKEEVLGKTPEILNSGKNPPGLFKNMWETILSGRIWRGTVINMAKTGEHYFEEMTVAPVMDGHGEIINFIAIKKDITERVRAEEELKQKHRELAEHGLRLRKLYEISFAKRANVKEFAKLILSEVAEILNVDAALIGRLDGDELVGFAVADRKGLGFKEGMRLPIGEFYCGIVSKTKKPLIINNVATSKEFKNHPDLTKCGIVSYLGVPLYVRDELFGILCTLSKSPHSYTEYDLILHQLLSKRLEFEFINEKYEDELRYAMMAAEAASRAKSEFLANMSHELRTPLNAILGFSEMMLQGIVGELTGKQAEYLRDIYESGILLLSLINDILDLSKIEAGMTDLEYSTDVDVGRLIDRSIVLFKEKMLKHGIKLTAEIEDDVETIGADERRLKQVLVNLLSNAVKFTPDGGAITVRARRVRSLER